MMETDPTIAEQHAALVHPDGSTCPDGCDLPPHADGEAALAGLFEDPPEPPWILPTDAEIAHDEETEAADPGPQGPSR